MNETLWTCCLLLVTLVAASENVGMEETPNTDIKVKRDSHNYMGLYPFPRVGRGSSDATWIYEPYSKLMVGKARRAGGLMVFPRVGRDKTHKTDKRNEGSNNGLWFGPRLGRLQKRDSSGSSQSETPWALITLRGYPSINSRQLSDTAFTPRLGRESNEDPWDDYDVMKQNSEHL